MVAIVWLSSACTPAPDDEGEPDLAAEARRIADTNIVVDTHIDVPFKILERGGDVSRAANGYDFDYPRARAGGLDAPFMSIYTDAELEAEGRSKEVAEQLIDIVEKIASSAPDKFALARSPADVRANFAAGLISLPMGMENGSPIEGDLDNLRHFYDRGIRYITLAHSLSNHISDSSFDENRRWHGLSDFGKDVVAEMNRLGIMIDVSHISDEAFWQVVDLSATPVIASHSSLRHFTPGFERNMSDEMIERLAQNGGVIQINFGSGFVDKAARDYDARLWPAATAWRADHPELGFNDMVERFMPTYFAENGPYPFASIEAVLDEIDRAVALAGIDHVGLGSDFDGVGDTLPVGLKDVSAYPHLVEGLLERGYDEASIRKILGENLLRVWSEVESYAAAQAASTSSST
jgi:membrane dipeptidase